MSRAWTTTLDIIRRIERRWSDGTLLRRYADGVEFEAMTIPLRGPSAAQLGDDLNAARRWVADLEAGQRGQSRYTLHWGQIGGRAIGRTAVPVRAEIATYEQAWALLGKRQQVELFEQLLVRAGQRVSVRAWIARRPLQALQLHEEFDALLAAYDWVAANRGSGRYLREISAPGVDTKFAERHRAVLAAMLDVPTSSAGFLAGLGLRAKPQLVRFRFDAALGLPIRLSELAARVDEVGQLDVTPSRVLIVENEISYLSAPIPAGGAVIWGRGFAVDQLGRLDWLSAADIVYWGDLDTHGFAILDRLRAWLPQARSVLMDRATLLNHRQRWGQEDKPATAELTRLTDIEQTLYRELVEDHHGERVRLEQERIDWSWAAQHLATASGNCSER